VLNWVGGAIARYLSKRSQTYAPPSTSNPVALAKTLQIADVLLVEGDTRISGVIKYLTQSTWSHAALYVGNVNEAPGEDPPVLLEADLVAGVRLLPLSEYARMHTRICRPVALDAHGREEVVRIALQRLGAAYDLKNVIDLARYLFPTPPVPARWRRRILALGSGDPTRAICSTLIAEAFQRVRYPILPEIDRVAALRRDGKTRIREIHHIRHYSLFAPRDFDISPYFAIVKPMIEAGFDYRQIVWGDQLGEPAGQPSGTQRSDPAIT